MSLGALLLFAVSAPNCAGFASRIDEPVHLSSEPIPGRALGGQRIAATKVAGEHHRIGPFTYHGRGVALRSSDPRFREIVLRAPEGVHHPCGAQVDAPSGWNARDRDRSGWRLRFRQPNGPLGRSPGYSAAVQFGAEPRLRGYRPGASWPASGFFIGLMHPRNGREETLILAFAKAPRPTPALRLARLPMRFEALAILPALHQPKSHLSLEGRAPNGAWRRIILDIDDAELARVGSSLARAPS